MPEIVVDINKIKSNNKCFEVIFSYGIEGDVSILGNDPMGVQLTIISELFIIS